MEGWQPAGRIVRTEESKRRKRNVEDEIKIMRVRLGSKLLKMDYTV